MFVIINQGLINDEKNVACEKLCKTLDWVYYDCDDGSLVADNDKYD